MEAVVYIGIDVSKDRLDVHVRPLDDSFHTGQSQGEIDALVKRLKAHSPKIIALEATGGYESAVVAALSLAGLPIVVLNPSQVRSFAKALGKRAKTDSIDAAVIAHFAEATQPKVRPMPDESTQDLATLIARRRQIVDMITAERQRDHQATALVKKSIKRVISALQKELAGVHTDIDTLIKSSPLWLYKEKLLVSAPGVGRVIARTLLAEMPELGTLDRKQAAALAGLAPYTRQSGQWCGKSFIGGGRKSVRKALFLGAMAAVRGEGPLKTFYEGLLKAGKPKMVALIAVERKLLTMLNAMMRDNKVWTKKMA